MCIHILEDLWAYAVWNFSHQEPDHSKLTVTVQFESWGKLLWYLFSSSLHFFHQKSRLACKLTRITTKYTLVKPLATACVNTVSIVFMEVSTAHFRFTYGSCSNNDIIISVSYGWHNTSIITCMLAVWWWLTGCFFAGPKTFSSTVHLCIDICCCQSHENGCQLLRFLMCTLA